MANNRKKKQGDAPKDLGYIENRLRSELNDLAKLTEEQKKDKIRDMREMIKYYNSQTDKVEDRRIRIHQNNLQFLAILATGLGLILSIQNRISSDVFTSFVFFFGIHILTSLVILGLYEFQSGFPYVFKRLREFGNKWKWFYYASKHIQRIDRNPIRLKRQPHSTTQPYLLGLLEFIKNYKQETTDGELQDNIQQLYLLQVHNYYKNRFYLQLVKFRQLSIIVTILYVLIYCGYLIIARL